jgi:F0F1-type ATP synthase membrane subunit b/b'
MKAVSRHLRERKTSITPLFAHGGAKFRLVLILAMFHLINISANAQRTADSQDSKGRPGAHEIVSLSSGGRPSQDEYADLKLSDSVRLLAHLARISPEAIFHLCRDFNFLLLVTLVVWKAWPLLTAAFEERSRSIRRAIDEAQHLREDARKRLAEVERLWARLDIEIVAIKDRAEAQMKNEERLLSARTIEDIRRITEYSKSEIDRAAQQARDELKTFAAVLAVSLARQSMRVDERTDQKLVKGFIEGLEQYKIAQTSREPPAQTIMNV